MERANAVILEILITLSYGAYLGSVTLEVENLVSLSPGRSGIRL